MRGAAGIERCAWAPMQNFVVRSVTGVLARIGRTADAAFRHAGEMTLLAFGVARATLTGKVAMRDLMAQLQSAGSPASRWCPSRPRSPAS